MGTRAQNSLTMDVCKLEVSPSYDQVVAAWAIFCLIFTGQSELSHTYTILETDTPHGEVRTSQSDTLITCRSQLLRETRVVDGDTVKSDQDIAGIVLQTAHLGGSVFADILKEFCPGSDVLALLVTHGQRLFSFAELDLPQPHFVCRIWENAITLETAFPKGTGTAMVAQIKGLADSFCSSIEQTVTNCQSAKTLQDIDILSENQLAQILQRNEEPYRSACEPVTETLLTKIQRMAGVAGDDVALCSSTRQISYAELDSLSDRLAAEFLQFSGKPGSFLPIVCHKSALAVVAMLAAWKLGAAFALIDPNLPRERQESVLTQLRSEALLLVEEETVRIASTSTVHEPHELLYPSNQAPRISPEAGLLPGCGLFDAAYVIFTSGTTGKPKGVVIEHHSISKSMTSLADASGLSNATRMLQYASYTFDACILEIFSTLSVGGAVFIPTDVERNNLLPAFIQEHAINTMLLTPSVLQILNPAECSTVKTVFTGGEKMSALAIEKWSSQVRLINAYGPTETAVLCSLLDRVTNLTPPDKLGWALGSSLWIVDVEDPSRLVPIGAVGELVVCGRTLARGYLDDPERTRAAFLNDPAWLPDLGPDKRASRRAYRTGDLVRYDGDGSLHIVGRKDQQIKLRGQRIELSEIELAVQGLLPHGVELAVEVARPGGSNSAFQLVLFIVIAIEDDYGVNAVPSILTSKNAVRRFGLLTKDLPQQLAGVLPGYMIPAIYIPISALPLTRSAKLDRKTLQSWVETMSVADLATLASSPVAEGPEPVGSIEIELQKLWGQVLSASPDHISRNGHFFRLGGDSIKAMQLVAMGRDAGIATSVENIFKYPVLWELAKHVHPVDDEGDGQSSDPLPFSLLETSNVEELKINASMQCDVAAEVIEDIYPCTPLQEGMLALSLKNPEAYIAHFTYETPAVEIGCLEQAWQQVLRRTSVLRTRFISGQSNDFLQVVLRDDPDAITVVKHLEHDPASQEFYVTLGSRTNQIHICPIDDGRRAAVIWSSHHATYDAVSVQHIISDVESLYLQQRPPLLRNFAAFIRDTQSVNKEAETRHFWMDQLRDSETCAFPVQPISHSVRADATLSRTIAFSRSANCEVTAANLTRAAWALVLSQYSGLENVVFGVTTSGRSLPIRDIDLVRGPTIATVPVHVAVAGGATLKDFLSKVQEQAVAMIPFEHFGLQNIRDLSPSARLACDIRSLLLLQFPEDSDQDCGHGRLMRSTSSQMEDVLTYPLNVECVFRQRSILVTAQFDNELISESQVERVLASFDAALQSVTQQDDSVLLNDLRHISDMDLEQILAWNKDEPTPVTIPIHEIIMNQARSQPSAPAVSAYDGDLSYGQLMIFSISLADLLQKESIGKEEIVPICFEKSVWTQVAILAVLITGATFVLLDPKLPSARLATIIEDVKAQLILCQPETRNAVSRTNARSFVVSQDLFSSNRGQSESTWFESLPLLKPSRVVAEDPAYIVFTSGSTGRPKGIVVDHIALSSSAMAHGRAIQIDSQARVLQFAAYTFDVSIGDILVTLALGGCVCVPSEAQRLNDLSGAIRDLGVNHACITSTVAMQLDPQTVPILQRLVIGGEPMNQALIDRWAARVDLINIYGPAECTVWCVGKLNLTAVDSASDIGHGMGAITWITEVDHPHKLAPIGAIGELVLEGPTLARGYFNDPTKTAEAFLIDPLWTRAQTRSGKATPRRVYRTGDLVRYRPDGTIGFVGRRDRQVKLRGQRIELAEIEHTLRRSLPQQETETVVEVINLQGKTNNPQLVAFVKGSMTEVWDSSSAVVADPVALESFHRMLAGIDERIASTLPSYMVPTFYIPMQSLPLSASGKLDRRALRAWGENLPASTVLALEPKMKEYEAPVGGKESLLASLWSTVLEVEGKIGRDDHFFRLGGDSIKAMRLSVAARRHGLVLSVESIFKYPLLASMAIQVESSMNDGSMDWEEQDLAPFSLLEPDTIRRIQEMFASSYGIPPEEVEDASPCTPLQEGLVSMSLKKQGSYVARVTFQLPRNTDLERLQNAWRQMLQNNPILRTVFVSTESDGVMQLVMKTQESLVEMCHCDEVEARAAQFTFLPGRQSNLMLLTPGSEDKAPTLTWVLHHAVYDGWSFHQYLAEVNNRYYGSTPAPVRSFVKFIRHLRKMDNHAAQTFWAQYLRGAQLCDFPPAPVTESEGISATVRMERKFEVPQRVTSDITVATVVRAAWAVVIARFTGMKDVVFASTMSGRNVGLKGIDCVRGPTIATIPVRVQLDPNVTVAGFLQKVQEEAVKVMPYEHHGLQNIQRVSDDAQHACEARSLLVLQPAEYSQSHQMLNLFKGDSRQQDVYTYPLTMECILGTSGTIDVVGTYDDTFCKEDFVSRLLQYLEETVRLLYESMSKPLSWEVLLGPHRNDLATLERWNSRVPPASRSTVHALFEQSVLEAPNKIALSTSGRQLTYEEVDQLSASFAKCLRGNGIGRGSLVGLCFDKSWTAVVAMLSVLKVGGAFFALDPTHPPERMREIAEVFHHCVICIDDALSRGMHQPGSASFDPKEVQPSDLAFVLFTSGSTGRPKGIEITHEAFCSSILSHAPRLGLTSASRVLQFSAYTYDVSMAEIFTTLAVGGSVCIPSAEDRLNNLSAFMTAQQVSWSFQTPTMASFLQPSAVPTLKTLVLGGEGATEHNLQTWSGRVQLINSYGPAECSIWTNCAAGIAENADRRNVGLPVGCSIYVTDPQDPQCLLPIGAVGELLVGGPNIARGYWKDSEKTAGSFLSNLRWMHLVGCTGTVYRTGDLGRYCSDGTIEVHGRKDRQVKLRGQRIELPEVEFRLRQCLPPDSDVAVDVIRSESAGSLAQLTAFIVLPDVGDDLSLLPNTQIVTDEAVIRKLRDLVDALDKRLPELLPSYMVPSLYIPIATLPLSASAKLDRNALQSWAKNIPRTYLSNLMPSGLHGEQPQDRWERQLQSLWADILRVPTSDIRRGDHFFRLGGDSIKAMRLVSAASRHNLHLTVELTFKHPVLYKMAAHMREHQSDGVMKPAPAAPAPFSLHDPAHDISQLQADITAQLGLNLNSLEDLYPCTALQEGMFALSLRNPGTYVGQFTFSLSDQVDLDMLEQAWIDVVTRTPIMRTRFVSTSEGRFMQAVIKDERVVRRISAEDEDSLLQNFQVGPGDKQLSQVNLCRNSVVWIAHHAVYDGLTIQNILRDVEATYRGKTSHASSIPFSLFVQLSTMTNMEDARNFWRENLEGAERCEFPALPTSDYQPRPTALMERQIHFSRTICTEVTDSNLFRAAWALTIAQFLGHDDIVFGLTISGRNLPLQGIESVRGPTIATVPARIQVQDEWTKEQFLQRVQDSATAMIPFEHLGLQNIQRLSESAQSACDIQSVLILQFPDSDSSRASDEHDRPIMSLVSGTSLDGFYTNALNIECTMHQSSANVIVSYDETVIPATQLRRVLTYFDEAIQHLSSGSPWTKVAELKRLHALDQGQILRWNDRSLEYADVCIHELIQEQARLRPHAPAICSWDGDIQYEELISLSLQLAEHLQQTCGIRPGDFVPICFEKCKWTQVAILGILCAGAAFVPLDPRNATSRRDAIIQDIGARIILCSEGLQEALSPSTVLSLVVNDRFFHGTKQSLDVRDRIPMSSANSPAYIVFTSGSTGVPKGIVVEHSAVSSSALAHGRAIKVSSSSRVLQFAAYTFDVSIGDMLVTLALGGCVCVPSETERINDLSGSIQRMHVNHACLTSTVALQLDPQEVPTLRRLVVGGEPMDESLVNKWADQVELVNIYGPAECTIWCMGKELSRGDSSQNIGWGMGATSWIVNPRDPYKLVPIGAAGELVLHGPTLARCYFKEPEKTKAAFLQNPAWLPSNLSQQSPRAYCTGDIVRYGEDGALHFIGRKDRQVKLRGHRIELAEVEVSLRQLLPSETEVAVEIVTPGGPSAAATLAAFVRSPGSRGDHVISEAPKVLTAASENQALQHLVQKNIQPQLSDLLPPYMLPSLYIPVSALPLSISAKLDRRTLRKWAESLSASFLGNTSANSAENRRSPEGELEQSLSSLWITVLKLVDPPGRDDHFFRLGGDSIRAMQLVSTARRQGIFLSVDKIFQAPILRQMAAAVDRDTGSLVESASKVQCSLMPFEILGLSSQEEDTLKQEVVSQCHVPLDNIDDMYPCTPLQEGLVALSIKEPGAYTARLSFPLSVDVDISMLKQAWENVVQRVPALRTLLFYSKTRGLIQVVLKKFFSWSEDAPETGNALVMDQLANQTATRPLCIFTIDGMVLTWTIHHALYDAFSLNLIFRLLDWEYSQPSLVPPPLMRCEYRKYIAEVCKRDNSQARVFWEKYLFETPDPVFPHPHNSAYRPKTRKAIRTQMPTDLRSTCTTVANLLRAAWALTVGAYANLDQVVFGTTLHGRDPTSPYLAHAVGPTIVTVPVRVSLENGQSLGELLQDIHDDSARVSVHAHLGLQQISQLSADARRACNFQHMFLVNDASTEQGMSKVLGAPLVVDNSENFQMYALEVECQVHASGVQARMFYDSEVINDTRAKWMLEHFNSIYRAICSAPASIKISALRHATASEQRDLLLANEKLPAPVPNTLHGLFSEKADQYVSRTAVRAWDGTFDYSEVDELSDQLAQLLIGKGVSPGSHVVICFEKSKWVCIAMLAILKAGGVCVPLNVTYPLERAHYVVSHVKALVCLSSARCAKIFNGCHVDVVLVNHITFDGHIVDPPRLPTVTPDDAAFVMFTSGTTGYPKGVVQTHSNLVTSTLAIGTRMGYTANSRILQFASFTFDVSLGDIFGAFFFGACICIPSEQQRLDALDDFIRDMRVDQACLTPAVARTLAGKHLPTLDTLSLGGEPLQLTDIRHWAGKVHLRNIYGVTECTIWCAISDPIDPSSSSPRNFGYGMGARLWIVDPADTDCLMPPGAIGELLVEGPIVGKGYLYDAVKTKTSFIRNPPWHPLVQRGDKVRLYRTGDLVRLENARSYEYLCRKDTQVKINGQRVELGEIENQLQQMIPPHLLAIVDQLSVLNSKPLVAFIASRDPAMATPLLEEERRVLVTKVRSALSSILPSHMLPAKYVFLERLPLSASGKVDRRALREQGEAVIVDAKSEGGLAAEHFSEQERQLSELWKSSIRLDGCPLGPDSNFFAVGGDSLAAMRLVSCARHAGIDLSVQAIFAHPTLADMAAQAAVKRVSQSQTGSSYGRFELVQDLDLTSIKTEVMSACSIESQDILDILPTSPLQHDYMVAAEGSPGWFCTQFVVQLRPSVQLNQLLHAWKMLFESHEILRTRIVWDGVRYLQVVHRAPFAVTLRSEDVAAYLESDQRCPFVAGGEMHRMAIIQDPDDVPTHLVWSAHHAIYDGWSIRLILRRLSQLYGASEDVVDGAIIEPIGKYIKHISRIHRPSAHEFWTSQLSGTRCQPLRQLSACGKQPCANAFYEHELVITPTHSPDRDSNNNITLPTILHAAMGLLVARRSQSPDAVLSLTLTGRNEAIAGIEEVIAPMITMVPLRIPVDPTTTLTALLRDVQARLQAMIPWEHTGWSNIARIDPDCGAACANAFPMVVQAFQDDDDGASDTSSLLLAAAHMRAIPMGAPPLPILSECRVQGPAVITSFRYDPSLFDRSFIADMCVEFETLVKGLSCPSATKCIGEL
ncbi:acetyl-CoA synthetase-like protein [Aspergillus saccharolyticus JOP 1030-1]|uniref:Acetyl-CoA synthetase-like protein n=1 Tax=Aspergillus saccharolyticus JOP 1030-1 TaxID=1450539 RepID=A0A318ZRH6_9EURO|nr:acetyl-CoA synthetase-like protein [Aspergillus saccharolyticus JOP 1030-1]PYH49275.1 acetyl-CoA synthetase-like protein [Aspergillus saccharolyticus JOP 1030-1]